jgi:hypothetical protein
MGDGGAFWCCFGRFVCVLCFLLLAPFQDRTYFFGKKKTMRASNSSLPPGGVLFDLAMNNLTRAGAVALMRLAVDCTAFADVRLVGNRLDFATMGAVLAAVRSNAEILAAAARGKRALVALVTADARVRRRLEAAAVASESREPHAAPVDRDRDGADQSVQVVDGGSSGNQDRQQHVDHEPQQCEHLAPPDVVATIWAALLDRPLPRGAATAKVFATYNSQSFVSDP